MKKFITVLIISIFALSLNSAFAHSPKDIELGYNLDKSILFIHIKHKVKNTEKHFIDKIEISVNDKVIKTLTPEKQMGNVYDKYQISVNEIGKGDAIEVKAYCSKLGKKSASIIPFK